MIKQHELAFLKTTGEICFVLGDPQGADAAGLGVRVRRPVAAQNGTVHRIDYFYPEELETLEEQRARFMAERQEVLTKYGPKEAGSLAPTPNDGFPIN